MMKRLTTDKPKDNLAASLNLFYIKDRETWVRGGGPGPEYADVSLFDFMRLIAREHFPDIDMPEDNDTLGMMMSEWLLDGTDSMEGIIALIYTAAWTYSELRERLKAYEDTGLAPNTIKAIFGTFSERDRAKLEELRVLLRAKREGRLVVLPCKVGDFVWALWGVPTEYKYVIYCAEVKEIRHSVRNCRLTTTYRLEPIEFRGRMKEYRDEDFGKTVFLTPDEAEAALAAHKNVVITPVNDLFDEDGGEILEGGDADV